VLLATPESIEAQALGAPEAAGTRPRDLLLLLPVLAAWGVAVALTTPDESVVRPDPAWAHGLREALRELLDETAGSRRFATGLVGGIAVGVTETLADEDVARMRVAGLAHVTAVSGGNVAVVLAMVRGLLGAGGVDWRLRPPVELAAVWGVHAARRRRGDRDPRGAHAHPRHPAATPGRGGGLPGLLAAVLLALAWQPALARDAGFAMSVAATAGLVVFTAPLRGGLGRVLPGPVTDVLAPTLAATASVQPLLILMDADGAGLHQVLANLLALPAVPAITAAGVLATLLAGWAPPVAALVIWLAAWPAGWVAVVAQTAAARPLGRLPWPEGPVGAGAWTVAVVLLALATVRGGRHLPGRWTRRPRLLLGLAVGITAGVALVTATGDVLRAARLPADAAIVQCDVGQGDALLLRGSRGTMLIDTGEDDAAIRRCLADAGVDRLDAVVLTHSDRDHVGSAHAVAQAAEVGAVLVPAVDDPALDRAADALSADRVLRLGRDQRGAVGDITWRVLHPEATAARSAPAPGRSGSDESAAETDRNAASLVLRLEVRGLAVLALGDLGRDEQRLVAGRLAAGLAPVDVVKVAHHGSRDHDPGLYRTAAAAVALVSVGRDNRYGHPHPDLLASATAAGTRVLRTDRHGVVALLPGAGDGAEGGQRVAVWCEQSCPATVGAALGRPAPRAAVIDLSRGAP
jgi:competence protein ComEC